ncbi:MAG: DUF4863 family protein [Sedimenticola sp.]|nr:DUF4863 family protein [Sedimenticola sp.]
MNVEQFQQLLKPLTDMVSQRPVDKALEAALTEQFPPGSPLFESIDAACHEAIKAGWMCAQGDTGRRFGRVIEPSDDTGRLSVDVVDLIDIAGPHHRHPLGEVCMVLPITEGALFDGKPRGWCVYPPESQHRPTVTQGQALILYLLPEGQIDFTR